MNKVENELVHSGKLGMKWGERKYQYEDGSLTPLGRIHYGVGEARKAGAKALEKVKPVAKKAAETTKKVGQKTKEVTSKAAKVATTAVKRSALKAAYKASDSMAAVKKARAEAKQSNADLKAKRAAEKEKTLKEKNQNAKQAGQKQLSPEEQRKQKLAELELQARDRSKMQDQMMKTFRGYYDPDFIDARLKRIRAESDLKDAINKDDALDRSFLDRMVNAKADHDIRKMYRQRKKYSTKELEEAKNALANRAKLFGIDTDKLHDKANTSLDKSKTVEMVKDTVKTAADPLKIKKGLTGLYNAYTTNTDKKTKKQAERAQKSAQKDYDAAKKNEATHEKFYKESRESMVNAYSEWQKNPTKENYDKYTHAFNNSRSALSSYNDTKATTSKALTTLDKYTTNNNNIKEAETKKQQVKADVNEAWAVAYGLYNLYKDNK